MRRKMAYYGLSMQPCSMQPVGFTNGSVLLSMHRSANNAVVTSFEFAVSSAVDVVVDSAVVSMVSSIADDTIDVVSSARKVEFGSMVDTAEGSTINASVNSVVS